METGCNAFAISKSGIAKTTCTTAGNQEFHSRILKVSDDIAFCILDYRSDGNRQNQVLAHFTIVVVALSAATRFGNAVRSMMIIKQSRYVVVANQGD